MDKSKQSSISPEQVKELDRQLRELVYQFDVLLDMLEKRQMSHESQYFLLGLMERSIGVLLTALERWVSHLATIFLVKIKVGSER